MDVADEEQPKEEDGKKKRKARGQVEENAAKEF
jgi:hypothetical protein